MLKNTAFSKAQWSDHNAAVNELFLHSLNFLMVLMKVTVQPSMQYEGCHPLKSHLPNLTRASAAALVLMWKV